MSGEEKESNNSVADLNSVDEKRFAELLTNLIRVGNRLAAAPSVDELCRQAVQAGLRELGFERMSIWLTDHNHLTVRGTFGTDEQGMIRDERAQLHQWDEQMPDMALLNVPQTLIRKAQVPLFGAATDIVGQGESGTAALWNGEEVIGLMFFDNLITRQHIAEERWHIFELYASTLAHLLTLKRTESALRTNEELLSQILDIMPVGVFVLAPEEKISHYNRAAKEMWEFDPASLAEWSPEAVWLEDGRPVGKTEWAGRKALGTGESVLNQEVEVIRSDGSKRVVLNSGIPLRDSAGRLTGAVVVNQDITLLKRREQQMEALARMGQSLRPLMGKRGVLAAIVNTLPQLLDAQGVAVVLRDEIGRLIFETAAADYASLGGMVVPPEWGIVDDDAVANANADTQIRVTDNTLTDELCFLEQLLHNPRFCVIAPLVTESASIGALVIGFDARPEAETLILVRALADASAAGLQRGQLYDEVTTQAYRLDRVMESVNFGLLLLDSQRRVVLANQHAQMKLGHLADLMVGEELQEFGGQRLGRFLTLRGGQARAQEIHLDGAIYEISTVPVGVSGTDGGWLMVIHDVTRERAIQSSIQQHQRLAAVGQLAAGIAHDFNNIVAVITLYVQMLQRNPDLPVSDYSRLNVIREQAQNASKLIRQILDFSRQTVIEQQPVDLDMLIQESMGLWERTLPENMHLAYVPEMASLPMASSELEASSGQAAKRGALILAEASSVQQALTNLAVNARDAMPDGGELKVVLRGVLVGEEDVPPVTGLKQGQWYEVCVVDNGIGISPEHLPHIFDPFFTTKDVGKGTGLGLAQVYGIVQQHGGVVTAQSEEGMGTSISLFLPALTDATEVTSDQDGVEVGAQGNETILLVEDNALAREATTALLEMLGYHVIAATDGREGLELFQHHREAIQLVLSDMVMPGMGGLELYRKIYAEDTSICLLIMTGYPLDQGAHDTETEGTVEWLQKPFTVTQLTLAVRRVLERARLANAAAQG